MVSIWLFILSLAILYDPMIMYVGLLGHSATVVFHVFMFYCLFCGCVFWVTFYWSIQLPVCLINLLPYLLTDRCRSIDVATVAAARRNGTMYAHVYVLPTTALSPRSSDWVITQTVPLTKHELPQASTFQLIGDSADSTVCWRLQSCLCVVQIIYCKLMFRGSLCRFIGNF